MLWLGLLLFVPQLLVGTELMPWFSRDFEIQTRATYLYQHYDRINKSSHHSFSYHAHDHFLGLSAGISACDLSAEVELQAANTRRERGLECLRLTGRYLLSNDILDDCISSAVGFTLTEVSHCALRDPSVFHHGRIEGEFHLSFGKELSCLNFWSSRFWGVVGIGIADRGWPWLRADAVFEKNWCDQHQISLFVHTLWGLGHHDISRCFHGYGNIQHRSVDLGFKYTYLLECGMTASFAYSHRVYAVNFPAQANIFAVSILYPFGL